MREPEGGGFLGRWAARKARAREAERESERPQMREQAREEPAKAGPSGGESPAAGPGPEAESEEELLARLGLPAPETLRPGDDFAAFMKAAIPQAIRRRALRRLWAINPDLANLDGLIDYGEDFSDGATVVEGMTTAWEAGKGYARAVLSDEEEAQSENADEAVSAVPAQAPEEGGDLPAPPAGDALSAEAPDPSDARESPGEENLRHDISGRDQDLAAAPRRMSFRFDEEA